MRKEQLNHVSVYRFKVESKTGREIREELLGKMEDCDDEVLEQSYARAYYTYFGRYKIDRVDRRADLDAYYKVIPIIDKFGHRITLIRDLDKSPMEIEIKNDVLSYHIINHLPIVGSKLMDLLDEEKLINDNEEVDKLYRFVYQNESFSIREDVWYEVVRSKTGHYFISRDMVRSPKEKYYEYQ